MNPRDTVRRPNRFAARLAAMGAGIALVACCAMLLVPGIAAAGIFSASGPDDGYAGNPPDNNNCTGCHDSYPVNSGAGSVQLLNLPSAFVPGNTYDLLVRLSDPDPLRMKWGFELTVLDAAAQQAGELVALDAIETQVSDNGGTQPDYIKHTYDGTHDSAPSPSTWPIRWIAPNLPSVTFYLAGNAANWSDDPSGDYIYTTSAYLAQAATGTENTSWGKIKALYTP